jgi:hypothetical protein
VTNANVQRAVDALSARGRYIEAGWISLRETAIAAGASAAQVDNKRMAFYAGAGHLFDCLGACMEIDDDERRRVIFDQVMQAVSNELDQFSDLIDLEACEVEGHA